MRFNDIFKLFAVYSEVKNQLKCTGGDNVTFACPCPEGFNSCRFKKFFQRGFILRDGVVSDDHQGRYAADGQSATITLKGCKKDDEGGYVSMCGGSDTNKEFHLSVVKVTSWLKNIFSCYLVIKHYYFE